MTRILILIGIMDIGAFRGEATQSELLEAQNKKVQPLPCIALKADSSDCLSLQSGPSNQDCLIEENSGHPLSTLPREIFLQVVKDLKWEDFRPLFMVNTWLYQILQESLFLEPYLPFLSGNTEEFKQQLLPINEKIIPMYGSLFQATNEPDFRRIFNEGYVAFKEIIEEKGGDDQFNGAIYFPQRLLMLVPAEISHLTSLRKLHLRDNSLRTLPDALSCCSQLEELSLNNNKFQNFPLVLLQLPSLKKLYLSNNSLATLPDTLSCCSQLEELTLNNNKFQTFPHAVFQITSLKKLSLTGNEISSLPDLVTNLKNLVGINMGCNRLDTYPSSLSHMAALVDIQLYCNLIKEIPCFNKYPPKLRTINLLENPLSEEYTKVVKLFRENNIALTFLGGILKRPRRRYNELL